jgi:hypothetical protein
MLATKSALALPASASAVNRFNCLMIQFGRQWNGCAAMQQLQRQTNWVMRSLTGVLSFSA